MPNKRYFDVQVHGYGGEIITQKITEAAYEWWEDHEDIFEYYTSAYDNEGVEELGFTIPKEYRFMDDTEGNHDQYFNLDSVVAQSWSSAEGGSYLTVDEMTEEGQLIDTVIDRIDLREHFNKFASDSSNYEITEEVVDMMWDKQEAYVQYYSVEKGTFFQAPLITEDGHVPVVDDFSFSFEDHVMDSLLESVKYKGELIDNDSGGDTNGKAFESQLLKYEP